MKKFKTYFISIAVALGIGAFSAFLTRNNMNIYEEIITPPLSPPSFIFPIVWTVLFILMGISAAIIYADPIANIRAKKSALFTYSLSLIVNFFWSIIFFNNRAFCFAFFWLLFLLLLIIRTIMKYYYINQSAAYLQIPYAIWVTFAGYLTAGICILNR